MTKAERAEAELREEWLHKWLVLDTNPFRINEDGTVVNERTAWAQRLDVMWLHEEGGVPLLLDVYGVTPDGEEVMGIQLASDGPKLDQDMIDAPPPNKYRQSLFAEVT